MYKTILVHADDSPGLEARLRAAARLASEQGAHLTGAAATGLSWAGYARVATVASATPGEEFERLRVHARAGLYRFTQYARKLNVASFEERLLEEETATALLRQSRYADLVVVGREAGGVSGVRGLPQHLALHGTRPVLAVPDTYGDAPIADSVLVGWDGSVAALRAIAGALPLLKRARTVRLVVVNPEREQGVHGEEPGADMALYLARHGVPAEVLVEETTLPAGDALLRLAHAHDAGLLVAGAFGHSRYRELVLGGVTRILLERAPLPVLFAH